MNYKKPVMKLSELKRMGFPDTYLTRAYKSKGQTFAWKLDPTVQNSPILFDTEKFEEYRIESIMTEKEIHT